MFSFYVNYFLRTKNGFVIPIASHKLVSAPGLTNLQAWCRIQDNAYAYCREHFNKTMLEHKGNIAEVFCVPYSE